ncbi:unnamed protein product [Effrenium voratum]|nr:unnamed protein product [Effrenium voratum]
MDPEMQKTKPGDLQGKRQNLLVLEVSWRVSRRKGQCHAEFGTWRAFARLQHTLFRALIRFDLIPSQPFGGRCFFSSAMTSSAAGQSPVRGVGTSERRVNGMRLPCKFVAKGEVWNIGA